MKLPVVANILHPIIIIIDNSFCILSLHAAVQAPDACPNNIAQLCLTYCQHVQCLFTAGLLRQPSSGYVSDYSTSQCMILLPVHIIVGSNSTTLVFPVYLGLSAQPDLIEIAIKNGKGKLRIVDIIFVHTDYHVNEFAHQLLRKHAEVKMLPIEGAATRMSLSVPCDLDFYKTRGLAVTCTWETFVKCIRSVDLDEPMVQTINPICMC